MYINTINVESSSWSDPTFPCYKYASYEMLMSLKMKSYMDMFDDTNTAPYLFSDPAMDDFGGLVSL